MNAGQTAMLDVFCFQTLKLYDIEVDIGPLQYHIILLKPEAPLLP